MKIQVQTTSCAQFIKMLIKTSLYAVSWLWSNVARYMLALLNLGVSHTSNLS